MIAAEIQKIERVIYSLIEKVRLGSSDRSAKQQSTFKTRTKTIF